VKQTGAGRRAPGRRLLLIAAGIMALFGVVMWALIFAMQTDRLRGDLLQHDSLQDYTSFYAAGKLVMDGRAGEIYDVDAIAGVQSDLSGVSIPREESLPYLNPPFVAVIFAPLTLLPVTDATAVLFVIELALVAICGRAIQGLIGPRDRRSAAFVWVAYLSAFSVYTLFLQLQLSMWAVLAWLGFIHFQRQGRDSWSAASLALGLVKPQLILLPALYLCVRGRFAALAPLAVAGSIAAIVSIAVAGPAIVVDYPRFLLSSTSWDGQGIFAHGMYGWNALVADLSGDATPPDALVAALVLPTLGLVVIAWLSCRQSRDELVLPLMGLTLCGVLLANPHLYLPDVILLDVVLALGYTGALARGGNGAGWAVATAGVWFLMLPLPGMQASPGGLPLLTLAMAVLFVHFWLEVRRTAMTSAAERTAAPRVLAA
jgi:hypothetical protein